MKDSGTWAGKTIALQQIPLASSLHNFQSEALGEAYNDLDLTRKGIAPLDQIEAFKDALLSSKILPFKKVKRIAPNKSGHYYLRKLSRSERKNYLKNLKACIYFPFMDWMRCLFKGSEEFIGGAFNWEFSVEGHEYWERLEARMGYVEQLQKL